MQPLYESIQQPSTQFHTDLQYIQYLLQYVSIHSNQQLQQLLLYMITDELCTSLSHSIDDVVGRRLDIATANSINHSLSTELQQLLTNTIQPYITTLQLRDKLNDIITHAAREQLQLYYKYVIQHDIDSTTIAPSSATTHQLDSGNHDSIELLSNPISINFDDITQSVPHLVAGDEVTIGRHTDIEGSHAGFTVTRISEPRNQSGKSIHRANRSIDNNPIITAPVTLSQHQSSTDLLQHVIVSVVNSESTNELSAQQQIMCSGGFDELTLIMSYLPFYYIYGKLCFVSRRFFACTNDYRLYRHINTVYLYTLPATAIQCTILLYKLQHIHTLTFGSSINNNAIQSLSNEWCQQPYRIIDNITTEPNTNRISMLPHLHTLNLSGCTQFNDDVCTSLHGSIVLNRLKVLNMTGCNQLSDHSISTIVGSCIELIDLTLQQTAAGIDTTRALASNNTLLQHINLSNCRNVTDAVLHELSQVNTELITINLSECWKLTALGVQYICTNLPNIQSINLSHCCTAVTDSSLHYIARHCTTIKHLYISGCITTDTALSYIIFGCTELNTIDCSTTSSMINKITNHSLIDLSTYSTSITRINLSGCISISDTGIVQLSKSCHTLHELNLSHCTELTNQSLHALANFNTKHTVHVLNISYCWHCSDDGVASLLRMPQLNTLNLAQCLNVTDRVIVYWAKLLTCRSNNNQVCVAPIQYIDLTSCTITDKSLTQLPYHDVDTKLHSIILAGCSTLTDRSVIRLAQCFKSIQHISLQGCIYITDRSIRHIADRYSSKLVYLNCNQCQLITDRSIQRLTDKCQQLHSLYLDSCIQLTDCSVRLIAQKLSQLNILHVSQCNQLTSTSIQSMIYSSGRYLKLFNISQCKVIASLVEQYNSNDNEVISEEARQLHAGIQRLTIRGCKIYT